MPAPQLINCQWFAAVTGSVIRVSPARGLEGPTVSSKHRNLSSCLSVPGKRERDGGGGKSEEVAKGREKEEGRLKSREKGSVSMATTFIVPPTLFPTHCRELWWSLCNTIPLECTAWISAEQCPQGHSKDIITQIKSCNHSTEGAFASTPDKAKAWQCSGD